MLKGSRIITVCLLMCSFAAQVQAGRPKGWQEDTVFVLPEAGRSPWLEAIAGAERTIEMSAYKLSDPQIIAALKAASQRGVSIHLLLEEETYQHGGSGNAASPVAALKDFATLYTLSKRFSQSHHKMILVDGQWGLVSTGNLDAESFDGITDKGIKPARDFAVPVLDKARVAEMARVFQADIKDARLSLKGAQLVWGPDNGRSTFLALINSAQKSIDVYQQSVQDEGLALALAGAARAGVQVRLLMMAFPFGPKKDPNIPSQNLLMGAGAQLNLATHLYIHAKIVIVDGRTMYLGSSNFYAPTLDGARELGVVSENETLITRVQEVFEKDWAVSQKSGIRKEGENKEPK